jgi:hypothetical protein
MSIYRRSDRVPLSDVTVTGPTQPTNVQPQDFPSQNDEHWVKRRVAQPANGLLRPTVNWVSALPADTRPNALLAKYPRIANLIAVLWQDRNSLLRYMDDLLVDKRGHRQGFPLEVLRELLALRAYYDEGNPGTSRPWEVMNNGE